MKASIHDYPKAYALMKARFERSGLSDEDKRIILEFDVMLAASQISLPRRIKYLEVLPTVARALGKPLRDVTKSDLLQFLSELESKPYSIWTTNTYRVVIKRFWKWLKGNDEEYPPEVKWIKTSVPRSKRPKRHAGDNLVEDEVKRMISTTTHPRDRAIIATFWDAGGRANEVGTLWNTDIKFDKYGAVISVDGKTGPRPIRLVQAVPYIVEWMSFHPLRAQTKYPLWITTSNRAKHQPLKYQALREMLRKTGKRAGITKRVNPQSWRHSRASDLAPHLNEFQMNQRFGWVHGSTMPGTYIHWSGKETDPAILRLNGIKTDDTTPTESPLKPRICSRCDTINSTDARFCRKCGMGLEVQAAMAVDEQVQQHEDLLAMLLKDPRVREAMQLALAEKRQPSFTQVKEAPRGKSGGVSYRQ